MALRQARILSSETDNTIKQEQTTNVNIKVQSSTTPKTESSQSPAAGIAYSPSYVGSNISPNFIQPQVPDASQYPSVPVIDNAYQVGASVQERDVQRSSSFEAEIERLTIKNQFLELLLRAYADNPIKINSCVICNNRTLMDMVKLLTGADKVELILNDDIGCDCGCNGDMKGIVYVSRILVTKDGSTTDLKYSHNDVYSEFVKFSISLKIVAI